MSAQHTQGRLHVGDGNNARRIIYDERGWAVADAKLFHARRQESEDIENARRLVACWNACEGVSTDDLEAMPAAYMLAKLQMVIPLFQEARDAMTAITEAQRKLHGISQTLADRMDEAGTFSVDDWRAAIAKVKGGAA